MTNPPLKTFNILPTVSVAISVLLLVTGCAEVPSTKASGPASNSGAEAKTPASTPESTPSSTPAAKYEPATADQPAKNVPVPDMPEAAKAHTEDGFKAFADYYLEVVNYSMHSGTTDILTPLAQSGCEMCSGFHGFSEDSAETGRWLVGGSIHSRLTYSSMRPNKHGNIFGVAKLVQEAHTTYSASGKVQSTSDGTETAGLELILKPVDDGWIVADLRWPR